MRRSFLGKERCFYHIIDLVDKAFVRLTFQTMVACVIDGGTEKVNHMKGLGENVRSRKLFERENISHQIE